MEIATDFMIMSAIHLSRWNQKYRQHLLPSSKLNGHSAVFCNSGPAMSLFYWRQSFSYALISMETKRNMTKLGGDRNNGFTVFTYV